MHAVGRDAVTEDDGDLDGGVVDAVGRAGTFLHVLARASPSKPRLAETLPPPSANLLPQSGLKVPDQPDEVALGRSRRRSEGVFWTADEVRAALAKPRDGFVEVVDGEPGTRGSPG